MTHRWLAFTATALTVLAADAAVAQTYPIRPIRMVVGFSPRWAR